jgi:hypothetical protein
MGSRSDLLFLQKKNSDLLRQLAEAVSPLKSDHPHIGWLVVGGGGGCSFSPETHGGAALRLPGIVRRASALGRAT